MTQLLPSPFHRELDEFINGIQNSCLICSPYVTDAPVQSLLSALEKKGIADSVSLKMITNIALETVVKGATNIGSLMQIMQRIQKSELVYLPRIHAKVYVADNRSAIITSANFTAGGSYANLEYGIKVDDSKLVEQVIKDINAYASLGSTVSYKQLTDLQQNVLEIRNVIDAEQKSVDVLLKAKAQQLELQVEDDLIRLRTKGRTTHALFAETILYVLAQQPAPTQSIHDQVQHIHPDLCGEKDRVIDGKHFGKLWKHQVRTAQVYLKRKGAIRYDVRSRLWHHAK